MAIVKSVKVAKSLIIPAVSWGGGGRHLVAKSDWANASSRAGNNNRINGNFVRYTR